MSATVATTGGQPHPRSSAGGKAYRFVAGDPLRALAALGVLLFHVAVYGDLAARGTSTAFGGAVGRFLSGLNIGVWMFFVLSGYLLGKPFADAAAEGRLPRVGPFLRNRLRRLGPGLVALVAVTVIVDGLAGSAWWRPIQSALFAQIYAGSRFSGQMDHAWTLDCEMAFYVFLPILFGLAVLAGRGATTARRRRRTLAIVVLIAVGSIAVRAATGNNIDSDRLPPQIMFGFAPGLCCAILEPQLRTIAAKLSTAVIAGIALLGILALGAGSKLPAQPVVDRSIAAVLGCGLIVGAALLWEWGGRRAIRLIDNRPLQWLGRRSYSFYLFHLVIVTQVATAFASVASPKLRLLAITSVALAGSLLAAEVGYRLVERPYMRRKEAWRAQPAPELQPGGLQG